MANSVIKKEPHFITLFHNADGLSIPATNIPLNYNRGNFRWLIITIGKSTALNRATFLVTGARNNNYYSAKISSSEEWAIQDVYSRSEVIMQINVNSGNDLRLFDVVGIV